MEDERCCGTGTCILNAEGLCWCGQQWNGTAMCFQSKPDLNDKVDKPVSDESKD